MGGKKREDGTREAKTEERRQRVKHREGTEGRRGGVMGESGTDRRSDGGEEETELRGRGSSSDGRLPAHSRRRLHATNDDMCKPSGIMSEELPVLHLYVKGEAFKGARRF